MVLGSGGELEDRVGKARLLLALKTDQRTRELMLACVHDHSDGKITLEESLKGQTLARERAEVELGADTKLAELGSAFEDRNSAAMALAAADAKLVELLHGLESQPGIAGDQPD